MRDQGQRGTCLAFAVTATHEADRAGGEPTEEDLAEEALYWGCKQVDGDWRPGTTFSSAAAALARWGQPDETVWPYDPGRPDGIAYAPPSGQPDDRWRCSGLRRIGAGLHDIRRFLDAGRPVTLGLALYDTFFAPVAGRIADPDPGSPARGGHAVVAAGYDPSGVMIRNSWGISWGAYGHATISNHYVDQHVTLAWVVDATAATSAPASDRDDNQPGERYGTA